MKSVHIDKMRNIQLFHSLTDKELTQIGERIRLKEFKKNQTILYEEDTSQYMYIILEGKVKIFQISDEGKEALLTMHGSGDFFGEMSIIDGKTAPARVAATEPSLIALVSKNEFYSIIHAQKKVLENLLKILSSRIRESWRRIQLLNFNNASQRVKMLFLMLAEDHGKKTPEGTTLMLRLIHQDIADMTGLTRETVTRVLDRWKRSGEIKVLQNRFIHLSPDFETIHF